MKIVFIIGNGFDICLGLKTKYEDFYNYYLNKDTPENKPQIKKLKEHLKADHSKEDGYKYWSKFDSCKFRRQNLEMPIINLLLHKNYTISKQKHYKRRKGIDSNKNLHYLCYNNG